MINYKDLFNDCVKIFNDKTKSPLARTLAKRELDRMTAKSLDYLKKTNPEKYQEKLALANKYGVQSKPNYPPVVPKKAHSHSAKKSSYFVREFDKEAYEDSVWERVDLLFHSGPCIYNGRLEERKGSDGRLYCVPRDFKRAFVD